MNTDYNQQANDFLTKTNTIIKIDFLKYDFHFSDDKEKRDIYKVEIKRGSRKISFNFGNSINNTGEYIGHKNLCNNKFGKYFFTKLEIDGLKKQNFNFINSFCIVKNPKFEIPTNYSILACLQKYDIGSFEDFCSEFGYSEDSKKSEKLFKAVEKEYSNVCSIWNDEELELLQEIN